MYENIQKPFEIQIAEYSGVTEPPDNNLLYELLSGRHVYQMVMQRDADIMNHKFQTKKERIVKEKNIVLRGKEIIDQNKVILWGKTPNNDELVKLEVQEIQHLRNVEKLANHWMELILEINDYCKMNINERTSETAILKNEIKEIIEILRSVSEDYPVECSKILAKVTERIGTGIFLDIK